MTSRIARLANIRSLSLDTPSGGRLCSLKVRLRLFVATLIETDEDLRPQRWITAAFGERSSLIDRLSFITRPPKTDQVACFSQEQLGPINARVRVGRCRRTRVVLRRSTSPPMP